MPVGDAHPDAFGVARTKATENSSFMQRCAMDAHNIVSNDDDPLCTGIWNFR